MYRNYQVSESAGFDPSRFNKPNFFSLAGRFPPPLRGTIPIHAGQQNLSDRKPPKVADTENGFRANFPIMVGEKNRPISFIIVGKTRREKKKMLKGKEC